MYKFIINHPNYSNKLVLANKVLCYEQTATPNLVGQAVLMNQPFLGVPLVPTDQVIQNLHLLLLVLEDQKGQVDPQVQQHQVTLTAL